MEKNMKLSQFEWNLITFLTVKGFAAVTDIAFGHCVNFVRMITMCEAKPAEPTNQVGLARTKSQDQNRPLMTRQ